LEIIICGIVAEMFVVFECKRKYLESLKCLQSGLGSVGAEHFQIYEQWPREREIC